MTTQEKRSSARDFLLAFADRDDWVVVDTETTGADPEDEVVELGVISADGDVLVDTLVKPFGEISEGAEDVHGISDEDVEDAPRISELTGTDWLFRHHPVLVYNASFDIPILQNSFARADVQMNPVAPHPRG